VPIVSVFYGITVRIYVPDHYPPHVHVSYGEFRSVMNIKTGAIMAGSLPQRSQKLFEEWRKKHKEELLEAFARAQNMHPPGKIEPLD
jgi:hypothetical protein